MNIFSCKETVRLVSEGLDRRLSLGERLGMRAHLLVCAWCRTYRRQVVALMRMVRLRRLDEVPAETGPTLSPEARQRMQAALRQQAGG